MSISPAPVLIRDLVRAFQTNGSVQVLWPDAANGSGSSSSGLRREAEVVTVRPYNHAVDFPALRAICKPVYGGMDALPEIVAQHSKDAGLKAVVVVPSGTSEFATFCAMWSREGRFAWLFGLRTAAAWDRRGFGTLAMRSLMTLAADGQPPPCVLSATTLGNLGARQIMKRLDFRMVGLVNVLRPSPASWAQSQQDQDPPLPSSSLAAARAAWMRELGAGASPHLETGQELVKSWRTCRDLPELQDLVRRAGRQPASSSSPVGSAHTWASVYSELYIPGYFDVDPLNDWEVALALQEGRVWVLDGEGGSGDEAGVCMLKNDFRLPHPEWEGGTSNVVGIVASSEAIAISALFKAASVQERFIAAIVAGWRKRRSGGGQEMIVEEAGEVPDIVKEQARKLWTNQAAAFSDNHYMVLGHLLPSPSVSCSSL